MIKTSTIFSIALLRATSQSGKAGFGFEDDHPPTPYFGEAFLSHLF